MSGPSDTSSDAARQAVPRRGQGPAVLEAETLFGGSREIVIVHAGQRYRLRITQNGKLILTK